MTDVEINGEIVSNVSGGRVPAPIWKEFMEKVVEDLPIEEWPEDPIEIDRYYEIPKVEIPDLIGLNVLDGEEIAFSNYILPVINLIDSEETPGLILSQNVDNCDRGNKSDNTEDESNDECIGIEMPEGTVVNLEVSGNKFSSAIPNIPPCTLSLEEGQSLIKEFMRETNVILFLKSSFESSELPGCEGKVIGTNFPQGGTVSTGDTLIFIIANSQEDQ